MKELIEKILKKYKAEDLVYWVQDKDLLSLECVQEYLNDNPQRDLEHIYNAIDRNVKVSDANVYPYATYDTNKLLDANTIDEIIELIFSESYRIKYSYYDTVRKQNIFGFYLKLESLTKKEFDKLHPFLKLHYNVQKKCMKHLLGDTNASDTENNKSECMMYLYEVLKEVFNGHKNDKLEDSLKIYDVNDIKRIIKSKSLSKRMCNYILTYVEYKVRSLSRAKSNPDFNYNSVTKKYEPIYYNYLDKFSYDSEKFEDGLIVDENSKYDSIDLKGVLDTDSLTEINQTGELASYFLDTYIDELTEHQKKFIKDFIEYGTFKDGSLLNYDNEVLYNKKLVWKYKNDIKKRLEKIMDQDKLLNVNDEGRMYLNWRAI